MPEQRLDTWLQRRQWWLFWGLWVGCFLIDTLTHVGAWLWLIVGSVLWATVRIHRILRRSARPD